MKGVIFNVVEEVIGTVPTPSAEDLASTSA